MTAAPVHVTTRLKVATPTLSSSLKLARPSRTSSLARTKLRVSTARAVSHCSSSSL